VDSSFAGGKMNTLERAKYRGKCVETGKWCVGSLNHFEDSATINICRVVNANIGQPENIQVEMDVDPETVGQWTGLTDKSGADIFQDDSVYIAGVGVCVVEWQDSDLQWVFEPVNSSYSTLYYQDVIEDIESVNSNIHDNPELLELSK
jgi:uncharacterized phage protein (TIGR01671 family)